MKKSALFLLCGCMALAANFHSCSKEDLDDFSGYSGSFEDARDGHVYKWIKIGDQIWMAENLAYLPEVSPALEGSLTNHLFYVYGYDGFSVSEAKATDNFKTYGVLYNWPAAMDACPAGWHLPTDTEWTKLENYLIATGYNYDGTNWDNKIAKAMATNYDWAFSSQTGTVGNSDYPDKRNLSGFSALPGGLRDPCWGGCYSICFRGYWWSATEGNGFNAWIRSMDYGSIKIDRWIAFSSGGRGYAKECGYSVRCVKD